MPVKQHSRETCLALKASAIRKKWSQIKDFRFQFKNKKI